MEEARVRAVLWQHLGSRGGPAAPPEARDPNALLSAAPFEEALRRHAERAPPGTLRAAGRAYAALWGRTFRTLCRHLQGRPEQALHLFCAEVYPFLRGDRRAARLDEARHGRARLVLREDLPTEYVCGLVEGFVALSGADAEATAHGHETFAVAYRVPPGQWFARLLLQVSTMRVPFLLSAAVAVLLGLAGASAAGAFDPLRAAVVLAGVVAVQAAANALNDLRGRREGGPFDAPLLPHWLVQGTLAAGYAAGAAAGVYLAATGTPWVAAWAVVGLGLSLLYVPAAGQGLGPLLAGLTYGPLVATGALHALVGWGSGAAYLAVGLASLPVGALAAAIVYVNDLADRPLDQAAGRRTLLVRLPRRSHVVGYAALVAAGAAGVLAAAWWRFGPFAAPALVAPVAAAALVRLVARHVDDPRALAPARAGTLAFHLAVGIALARLVLEPLP